MVICKLKGGLGNQLFQWAYAKHISNLLMTDLVFDVSFLLYTPNGVTKRNFELDKFPKINAESKFINGQVPRLPTVSDGMFLNTKTTPISDDYLVDGYFQDYRYFEESSSVIRDCLTLEKDLVEKIKNNYGLSDNDISIHIRRTDYLKSQGYHPVLPIDYYYKAIEEVGDYNNIFVFSDDINWCKENLNFRNMQVIETNSISEDFYLMSLCKNNIIANSSFSWWAAWANNNPNKKVIMPNIWYGPNVDYDPECSPKEWIRIQI
jgi:hypothetical protein